MLYCKYNLKQKEGTMTNFAIHTQTLENYGAHSESGKYSDGNAYWKFKSGTTYIVSDVERLQDAVAFVMACLLYTSPSPRDS